MLVLFAVLAADERIAQAQSAEDRETARVLFEEGKGRRDRGDKAGALDSFKAADALMNVPTTKLALARAYVALGRLTEGRDVALKVAQIPTAPNEAQPFAAARGSAAELATELAGRIPSLLITIIGAPASPKTIVTIDGTTIPSDAWPLPRRLNPGAHVVVAKLGGEEARQDVSLAEKESKTIRIDLTKIAQRLPATTTDAAQPKDQGSRSPLLWIGLGVAVVGVGVGTTAGLMSISKKSDADTVCIDGKCPPSGHDALESAKSWGVISTIGFAGALAGAALAGVGLALGRSTASSSAGNGSPRFALSGAGVVGSF